MPENEFTEFQRRVLAAVDRVLAAVEKPKRGRLLAIINSSFFLWLMSVLLLTIGGSYITNHRQCLDDAEKIIDRRFHLRDELYSRDTNYSRRVAEATTLREAAYTFPDKRGSIFADLANLTYQELQREYHALDNRISYEEFHDLAIDKFRFDHDHLFFHYMGRIHANTIKDKLFSADDEAHLLKSKQLDNNAFSAIQNFNNDVEFGYEFSPDCSAFNTAAIAFGYRLPIVFAEARSDRLEDPKRRIEEVEQAKKDAQSQAKKDAQLLEGEPH